MKKKEKKEKLRFMKTLFISPIQSPYINTMDLQFNALMDANGRQKEKKINPGKSIIIYEKK